LKNKGLIAVTIIFFLVVNSIYYWEGKLALFAFPVFLALIVVYFILSIALLRQLYLALKEKFRQKSRFIVIGVMTIVLLLTFYRPLGLIDFDKLEGKDVLVAEREGAANCLTTLKLKQDFTFRERIGCFGVTEIRGTFKVMRDTIFFENIKPGRGEEDVYKFAVIKPTKSDNLKILGYLVKYKDLGDTVGYEMWITKNELQTLNNPSRTARQLSSYVHEQK
jgi:hypothetical protein